MAERFPAERWLSGSGTGWPEGSDMVLVLMLVNVGPPRNLQLPSCWLGSCELRGCCCQGKA
jgi:hypothetical protein